MPGKPRLADRRQFCWFERPVLDCELLVLIQGAEPANRFGCGHRVDPGLRNIRDESSFLSRFSDSKQAATPHQSNSGNRVQRQLGRTGLRMMTLKGGAVPANVVGNSITRFAPKFLQGPRFRKWQNKGAGFCANQVIRCYRAPVCILHEVSAVHKLPNQVRAAEIQNPAFRTIFVDNVRQAAAKNWSKVRLTRDVFARLRDRDEYRSAPVSLDKISSQVIELNSPGIRLSGRITKTDQTMFSQYQSLNLRIAAILDCCCFGQQKTRHSIRNVADSIPERSAPQIFAILLINQRQYIKGVRVIDKLMRKKSVQKSFDGRRRSGRVQQVRAQVIDHALVGE